MTPHSKQPFTGKHMLAIMVAGFGIVAAVNFTMASYAVGGFHGIVVENSYVASQKFNGWMDEAEKMRALGWSANATRDEAGHIIVASQDVPEDAVVTAQLRRPLGAQQWADLSFIALGEGHFRSVQTVDSGRWSVRLTIEAQGDRWVEERALQ